MARRTRTSPKGYEVAAHVERLERLPNTKNGNPRWRLHTDRGVLLTDEDAQRAAELTGDESGAAVLLVEGSRVIDWRFPGGAWANGSTQR